MKKKEGRVDDGPVDESFIGSSPHTAVAGAAAAVAKCREAIIMSDRYKSAEAPTSRTEVCNGNGVLLCRRADYAEPRTHTLTNNQAYGSSPSASASSMSCCTKDLLSKTNGRRLKT